MLKRKLYKDMERWKSEMSEDKALFLMGARQVGKSTLARYFGWKNYEQVIEINFLEDPSAARIFKAGKAEEILTQLTAFTMKQIVPGKTLVILDEIQECPAARTAIKFLVQEGSCSYIETGSLLGIQYKPVQSYPVGFEQQMNMYPLDFEEFLWAIGFPQTSIDHLHECYKNRTPVGDAAHGTLLKLFQTYLVVGGMPEVVQTYADTKDISRVVEHQNAILTLYRSDITKYTSGLASLKTKQIFDSIPAQLDEKNRRFKMNSLGKNRQYRDLESCFLWLEEAGIALPCYNTKEPAVPLLLNEKRTIFRLYLCDTGLLCASFGSNVQIELLQGNTGINSGSILENAYAQALASKGFNLYYHDAKYMELDFVVQNEGKIDLLEIKSGNDYQKHRSLDKALENPEWKISQAIVFCKSDVAAAGSILYLPLYMIMFYGGKEEQQLLWDPLPENFIF